VRGQPGQIEVAGVYRELLAGSAIRASHREGDERVQDPYCLRCQPQVMGAALDQARHVAQVLLREANAVTDNPLVFEDTMISGGNFHGQPVALALDFAGIATAELANISERRIEQLVNPHLSSGLPAFGTRKRAQFGLHDRASDGGGAGVGKQDPRASG